MGDSNGCTPLQWAAIRNDPECLRLLLVHGANPNLQDKEHCLPINEISWHGAQDERGLQKQDRCVQILIQDGRSMYGAQFFNKWFHRYWTPLNKACYANRHAAVVMLLAAGAQILHDGAPPANAITICVWENSHESLGHILREKEQLNNMTVGAWWFVLHAAQCSADSRTLRMLVDEELTIKGLTAEEWEWLACLTAPSEPSKGLIANDTERKFLYKEFIGGLRERAGFDPIVSRSKWNWPNKESSHYNLDDDDTKIHPSIQLERESGQNSEQGNEDEVFEDAIEYHEERDILKDGPNPGNVRSECS